VPRGPPSSRQRDFQKTKKTARTAGPTAALDPPPPPAAAPTTGTTTTHHSVVYQYHHHAAPLPPPRCAVAATTPRHTYIERRGRSRPPPGRRGPMVRWRRVGRGAAPHPPDLLRLPGASVSAAVARRRWDTMSSQRCLEAGSATWTPPVPSCRSTCGTKQGGDR
jgi:hypothetical protein